MVHPKSHAADVANPVNHVSLKPAPDPNPYPPSLLARHPSLPDHFKVDQIHQPVPQASTLPEPNPHHPSLPVQNHTPFDMPENLCLHLQLPLSASSPRLIHLFPLELRPRHLR